MKNKTKLNEILATAVSGNSVLSSTLYVTSVAVLFSGIYAPFVLALVALTLYFYKYIYAEVVEALPVNGGVYTCLLNSTSKIWASISGVLTFLSYIAAAVISAKVAIEYLNTVISVPVIPLTIALLFVFAILVIMGMRDSAMVALVIFIFHIITLVVFVFLGIIFLSQNVSLLPQNILDTNLIIQNQRGFLFTLFFAFSACFLGVTGFESSANFVEEQKKGVFRKTLRNMLLGSALFNPLIALLVLNVMPIENITDAQDFLLAIAANEIGGVFFKYWVVADAFLVLAGAVLTSYIGICGLISRMSLDNCLPAFLSKKTARGSYPYISIGFFIVASSVLLITRGNLISLAGMYTIAFLTVMSLYALGNMILRLSRKDLKRTLHSPASYVLTGFFLTTGGIIGNSIIQPENVKYFSIYFIPSLLVVITMVYKSSILRGIMRITRYRTPFIYNFVHMHFENAIEGRFVVFIQSPNRVFESLDYINKNEAGRHITIVYCLKHDAKMKSREEFKQIKEVLPYIKKAGVFPHFHIKLLMIEDEFSPKTVSKISRQLKIEKNRILMGSIHDSHKYSFDAFGGVRIIF